MTTIQNLPRQIAEANFRELKRTPLDKRTVENVPVNAFLWPVSGEPLPTDRVVNTLYNRVIDAWGYNDAEEGNIGENAEIKHDGIVWMEYHYPLLMRGLKSVIRREGAEVYVGGMDLPSAYLRALA